MSLAQGVILECPFEGDEPHDFAAEEISNDARTKRMKVPLPIWPLHGVLLTCIGTELDKHRGGGRRGKRGQALKTGWELGPLYRPASQQLMVDGPPLCAAQQPSSSNPTHLTRT